MVVVEARILDPTHLELATPVRVPPGGIVLISLAEPGDQDEERAKWSALSAASLANAYSECEPDYSLDMVREPNPEYSP